MHDSPHARLSSIAILRLSVLKPVKRCFCLEKVFVRGRCRRTFFLLWVPSQPSAPSNPYFVQSCACQMWRRALSEFRWVAHGMLCLQSTMKHVSKKKNAHISRDCWPSNSCRATTGSSLGFTAELPTSRCCFLQKMQNQPKSSRTGGASRING